MTKKAFSTRAVHAGERLSQGSGKPVVSPIHPSVGYIYESMDDLDRAFNDPDFGYIYPRYGSPTVSAFESAIAELEEAQAAHAFASGMAAIHMALLAAGMRAGSTVVAAMDVYGATYALIQNLLKESGVRALWVDVTDHDNVENALAEAAESQNSHPILLAETISNPLLKVTDVPRLAELAQRYQARLLIDNTFASPYLFNPLLNGADYAIHSVTKYLAGHGDVMAGVVATSSENYARLYEINKLLGGNLGPFEAWLALRGVKTLHLRMRQQCSSASEIAAWLNERLGIERVNFPGLVDHHQHELAGRLFGEKGFGGVLSFEIPRAGREQVFRFMEALHLIQPAATLGDIYTLALHPSTSSHRTLTPEERQRVGISDGLVRLSVGIEAVEDIIADLEQALDRIR